MTESDVRTANISVLENLRREDLAPQNRAATADRTALILKLVLLLCAIVFCGSAVFAGSALYNYYQADHLYGDIADSYLKFSSVNPLPSAANPYAAIAAMPSFSGLLDLSDAEKDELAGGNTPTVSAELLRMRRVIAALRLQNKDTYGWVSVAGTAIDYPVVQAADNDYYLNHAFTGIFLEAGAIYTDYRNSKIPTENQNTIIYGHNVKSGIMFHCLQDYFDGTGDYLRAHPEIVLATDNGIYTYRIFALYRADANENYIRTQFNTRTQFVEFLDTLCERTDPLYRTLCDTPDGDDTILTLSTCTNRTATDERYAIHAYLVSVEK